jgi:hypothetical protein
MCLAESQIVEAAPDRGRRSLIAWLLEMCDVRRNYIPILELSKELCEGQLIRRWRNVRKDGLENCVVRHSFCLT